MGVERSGAPTRLRIDRLAAGGRGVGRVEGKVWLVDGGLPGDELDARVQGDRGRWVQGVAVAIVEPGPGRRTPACPFQGRCGGCPWMPLREDEQRAWKRHIVVDALLRIAKIADPPVAEIRAAGPALRYRNRVEFTVGSGGSGTRTVGLHPAGSAREWVDVDRCLLQAEEADAILTTVRSFLLEGPGAVDPGWDVPAEPLRIGIRWSETARQAVVVLRSSGPPPPTAAAFAAHLLSRHGNVRGVVHVRTLPGRRGGGRAEVLAGDGSLEDRIGGERVPIPADAFTQVQIDGGAVLTELVVEQAGSPREVLELFGGMGGFALALARRGVHVRVVEADPTAIEAGIRAAEAAGVSAFVRFERARVERALSALGSETPAPDTVIADPPRTGLGKPVAVALTALRAPRVVLVSCDPGTFARDARVLLDGGYRLDVVVPIDLFPQTPHVETVARFTLREASASPGAQDLRRGMSGAPPRPASG